MTAEDVYLIAVSPEQEHGLVSLEEASTAFNSPNPALRTQGEAVFLQLRQSEKALEHALFALERSQDAFVHFQCLSVVLERLPALPLQAPTSSIAHLSVLREFLLSLIWLRSRPDHTSHWWPQYTRNRACQAFAAVEHRLLGLELELGKEDGQAEKSIQEHTMYIQSKVVTADPSQQHVALSLASALIDELTNTPSGAEQYTGRSSSSSSSSSSNKSRSLDHLGLSPLQLRWVRAWMQEQMLQHILGIVATGISSILTLGRSIHPSTTLSSYASVAEKVLRWQPMLRDPWAGLRNPLTFGEVSLLLQADEESMENEFDEDASKASGVQMINTPRFIPEGLLSTFLNDDLIKLLATAYTFSMQQDTISNREAAISVSKLQRCILAVSGFSPYAGLKAPSNTAHRKRILLETVKVFLVDLHSNNQIRLLTDKGNALLFLAQMYHVILNVSDTNDAANLYAYGLDALLEDLSFLTKDVFSFAFSSRIESDEEDDVNSLADDAVRTILAAWMECVKAFQQHSASGTVRNRLFEAVVRPFIDARLQYASMSSAQNEEDEEDELDEAKESDQEAYEDTLVILATLARYGNLSATLNHLLHITKDVSRQFDLFYRQSDAAHLITSGAKQLEGCWEVLHWLLLIVGHVMCDSSKGEVAMVPPEIASLSEADQEIVVRLVDAIGFDLVHLHAEASLDKVQSPQVVQSLIWFNARWIPAYLLVQSTPTLSKAFGANSGRQKLSFLLTHSEKLIARWLSDADVLLQVASLLRSFSLSQVVMSLLLSTPEFERLVEAIIEGLPLLPARTHKALISSLIGCIYASASNLSPEAFFDRITSAIEQRLSTIVHQPNFVNVAVAQRGDVVEALLNALDMFDGLAASTQPRSARAVFGFLSRFFDTLINLLTMYKKRAEVEVAVIRIFRTLVGALDLGFGVEEDIVSTLNEVIWRLMESIDVATLVGDLHGSALEEDIPFEGLCLVLDMLDDLLLATEGDEHDSCTTWLAPVSHRHTGDVCLFGFTRLVPVLLNGGVLCVSNVRVRLAHLISQLFLLFGHRLFGLFLQESLTSNGVTSEQQGNQDDCQRLINTCTHSLAMTFDFDETKAVLDSLEAVDGFSGAVRRVLVDSSRLFGSHSSSVQADRLSITKLVSPLLDAILRAILIEPVVPTILEACVQRLRRLIDVIITASVTRSDGTTIDGRSQLQEHLGHFCHSTSLDSVRRTTHAGTVSVARTLEDGPDVHRRRSALAEVVAQLAELCASSVLPDVDRSEVEMRAREVAWKGRLAIQIR